ncbi:MAG: hypothetical protein A2745_00340 [Candidatus Harrisonbacteria bacterium RIFCSPHIGHO2_01_FULL_44_13]|uniref:Uncharacterized protein n=1 Tax=Candidatus Harrisonbacteria bacterium RIFCSPLOWO2_01_FULL_44_18 TaxID=1798407 RepID=A0A1G1ZQ48_9BACT|nr:MAG: hypothetical protein A2745_00340 [Candidatus Harrisonbacteria bacterium RIFCSPHIGHO2_01_FULL_44_13]OGY66306.1 MAG: hypothetical protein A3A16_00135 [Candidatus Harrisonbacteria bacterium RIFCSPLOWO2_01_FULL_44_18]
MLLLRNISEAVLLGSVVLHFSRPKNRRERSAICRWSKWTLFPKSNCPMVPKILENGGPYLILFSAHAFAH